MGAGAPNRSLNEPSQLAKATKPSPVLGSAVEPSSAPRRAAGASRSRPADSAPAPRDGASLLGKSLIAESGLQIAYRTGAKVSLQGPFQFAVTSDKGGTLYYGKATVRVEKDCQFAVQMPSVKLTCSNGEFGVDLDRSGNEWIHAFRGRTTVWLDEGGQEAKRKIEIGENQSHGWKNTTSQASARASPR